MNYFSTRGAFHGAGNPSPQHYADVLISGLAPDGGLMLPERYPKVTDAQLTAWRSLSYADLAYEILSLFASDIPAADLKALTHAAYTKEVFGSTDITPLKTLAPNLHIQGLSNGPTLAFKDCAMQYLGHAFEYVLRKRGERLTILGATSGDTGSAAEYAMRGKERIEVFMLSPAGRMSAFQRAQMYSLTDANIHNLAIEGVFDDCQDIVKAISSDLPFKAKHNIGTVNSINWGRISAQVVYYFKGYFAATQTNTQKVSFAVPSGNFGNILAGHIAREMGCPIDTLVLATNENNVLAEFFQTGIYRPRSAANTFETSSPSMDISKASNFERFVFDLFGRDPMRLAGLWKQLEQNGFFDVSATAEFKQHRARFGFVSGTSTHADRLATIKKVWDAHKVMIDTHTADAMKCAWQAADARTPMIVLETALPVKFAETIKEALGIEPPLTDEQAAMMALPQYVKQLPVSADAVKAEIVSQS